MRIRVLSAVLIAAACLTEGCTASEVVAPLISQFVNQRANNPAAPGTPGAAPGGVPGAATPAAGAGGSLDARQPTGLPPQQTVTAGGGIGAP